MSNPINRRSHALRSLPDLSLAAAGLLLLAGCGSSGGDSASASSHDSAGMTVTVRDSGGMDVLATSSGLTLYVSDEEKGKVLCTSSECESVWTPLTVNAQQQPTASGDVADELSTVKRQDGSRQVTYDGRPLYTFSFDHSAGQVNGDGQTDSFDGTDFTWHAATPDGAAPDSTPSQDSGSGYSY